MFIYMRVCIRTYANIDRKIDKLMNEHAQKTPRDAPVY